MDPQTVSYWASIVGVPIAILGLILTYLTLKNRIETIGTQINTRINQEIITKIENIAYQLRVTQKIGGNHYENCIIVKGAESPEKIAEKYKKSMGGMMNNE
jgi:hypothetical protein